MKGEVVPTETNMETCSLQSNQAVKCSTSHSHTYLLGKLQLHHPRSEERWNQTALLRTLQGVVFDGHCW